MELKDIEPGVCRGVYIHHESGKIVMIVAADVDDGASLIAQEFDERGDIGGDLFRCEAYELSPCTRHRWEATYPQGEKDMLPFGGGESEAEPEKSPEETIGDRDEFERIIWPCPACPALGKKWKDPMDHRIWMSCSECGRTFKIEETALKIEQAEEDQQSHESFGVHEHSPDEIEKLPKLLDEIAPKARAWLEAERVFTSMPPKDVDELIERLGASRERFSTEEKQCN